MDRRKFFLQSLAASATLYLGSQTLLSCKKDDPVTTVKDIVDTAKLDELKASVLQATSAAALPAAIISAAPSIVPAATVASLASVNISAVAQQYKDNAVIPSTKVESLKANDPFTANSVLAQMAALPTHVTTAMADNTFTAANNNASLKAVLPEIKVADTSLYANDYYQAALDMQNISNTYVVPILEKIAALRVGTKSTSSPDATESLDALMFLYLWWLGFLRWFYLRIYNALQSRLTHQG